MIDLLGIESEIRSIQNVPIFVASLDNKEILNNEFNNAIKLFETTNEFKANSSWKSHHISDPTFTEDFITKYECINLASKIQSCVLSYLMQIGATQSLPYKILSSWVTKTYKGEYAHIHGHGDADISGVYYYKTTGLDGNLFFTNPLEIMNTSKFLQQCCSSLDIKPEVGNLVLFPGWLKHGVRTNTTENERMSLSFNLKFV